MKLLHRYVLAGLSLVVVALALYNGLSLWSGFFGSNTQEQAQQSSASDLSARHSKFPKKRYAASNQGTHRNGSGLAVKNTPEEFKTRWAQLMGPSIPLHRGSPVFLRSIAWGRSDALTQLDAKALPTLGDCQSDGAKDASGNCLHRVEIDYGAVKEWWEHRPNGVEQGFTLSKRNETSTDKPLRVVMQITGARVTSWNEEALVLAARDGEQLRYSHLAAFDSAGTKLAAWFEVGQGNVHIVVDDADAVYPLVIDPLLSSSAWFVEGESAGSALGTTLGNAGDINGDGFDDLLVGGGGSGQPAYVYYGSADGLSEASRTVIAANGGPIAAAGDVNGDGLADVIVADWNAARVYVYYGSLSGLNLDTRTTILSRSSDEIGSGPSIAAAGDVNSDGFADVVIGASRAYQSITCGEDDACYEAGRAFIYLGSASGISTLPAWQGERPPGAENIWDYSRNFGVSVAGMGDVNGDGVSDVLIGETAFTYTGPYGLYYPVVGQVLGYYGQGNNTALSPATVWDVRGSPNLGLGSSIGPARDVNGDGFADIFVSGDHRSTRRCDPGPEHCENDTLGRLFIYTGKQSTVDPHLSELNSSPAITLAQERSFGRSASAGDINGDGFSDIVVGAPALGANGQIYAYSGGPLGLSTSDVWTESSSIAGAQFGSRVAANGDFNGDGYSDVAVGSPGASSYKGRVDVYYGAASALTLSSAWTAQSGQDNTADGVTVTPAGDVNGDGLADVLVTAPLYDNSFANAGRVWVYHGSTTGVEATAAWSFEGSQADMQLGVAAASAGDINGDGYSDVIVGAANFGGDQEGRVYVFLGSSTGLNTIPSKVLDGKKTNEHFGAAVASAGDVNGDGFSDILIGSPGVKDAKGRATLYYGSFEGLSKGPGKVLDGEDSGAHFGQSLASAGDLNGDGFSDIVIGASAYGTGSGEVYVFFGSHAGITGSPGSDGSWRLRNDSIDVSALGDTVSGAGDVNGDGYGDLLLGTTSGEVYVFYGADNFADMGALNLSSAADYWTVSTTGGLSSSVAAAGDVDGDGYSDILVGVASIYHGGPAGLGDSNDWLADVSGLDFTLGHAAASAGDVNGDGVADILLSAVWPSAQGGAILYVSNNGRAVVATKAVALRDDGIRRMLPGASVGDSGHFKIQLSARSPFGPSNAKLEVELKPVDAAFDGTNTVIDEKSTPVGFTSTVMSQRVGPLERDHAYKWRARVVYQSSVDKSLAISRWYYSASGDTAIRGACDLCVFEEEPSGAGTGAGPGHEAEYIDGRVYGVGCASLVSSDWFLLVLACIATFWRRAYACGVLLVRAQ